MVAHERALEWQELFDISTREEVPEEEVKEIAYRVSGLFSHGLQLSQLTLFTEELLSKKRHLEAARVFIDYAGDIRQAVIALVQGNEVSEARRIVSTLESVRLCLPHLLCRYHCIRHPNSLKM